MSPLILDTGPIVALLDRRDPLHEWVAPRFAKVSGPLFTTGAVVTEATYFLQNVRDGVARLFEFLAQPRIRILDSFLPSGLGAAAILMQRYADTPMDFADATLVVLAGELGTHRVLTLDERGFRTYRLGRNRSFRLILQDGDVDTG
jgi:predicted nucleic acid-binding protein